MARMMARDNAIGPGGVDCRHCCGAHPAGTARTREKRSWQAEAEAEIAAEESATEFNMDNAIGILFGDVDPK